VLRIGVDIIEVARIQQAVERHGERFYQRVFTPAERQRCGSSYPALAARFAAKEAVVKALGTGIGDVKWTEIEVVNNSQGGPEVRLYGTAAQSALQLGLTEWALSLSHTRENAIALVVASG
jgi:holo-[acyl-carrier protein] synthase